MAAREDVFGDGRGEGFVFIERFEERFVRAVFGDEHVLGSFSEKEDRLRSVDFRLPKAEPGAVGSLGSGVSEKSGGFLPEGSQAIGFSNEIEVSGLESMDGLILRLVN